MSYPLQQAISIELEAIQAHLKRLDTENKALKDRVDRQEILSHTLTFDVNDLWAKVEDLEDEL